MAKNARTVELLVLKIMPQIFGQPRFAAGTIDQALDHFKRSTAADDAEGASTAFSRLAARVLWELEDRFPFKDDLLAPFILAMAGTWIGACRHTRKLEKQRRSIRGNHLNKRKRDRNRVEERDNAIRREFGNLMKTLSGATECCEHLARQHDMSTRQIQRILRGPKAD